MRKIIAYFLIVVMLLSLAGSYSYAEGAKDLRSKLKLTKENIKSAKSDYRAAKAKEANIQESIESIEASIKKTESELRSIAADIKSNNEKIDKVSIEIEKVNKEIGSQNSGLMGRLRVMYTTGDISMIEVLLDSADVIDFLSNLDMIQRIHAQDVKLLDELNTKLELVEQKKAELVKIKNDLNQKKTEQKQKASELASKKKKLAAARAEAQAAAQNALEEIENLQEASAAIEEELKKLESKGTYGGGKMGWPVNGSVTSEYGWRTSPTTGRSQLHAGIDIAASTGTPVYAAADGVIYSAGWNSGGYGNLVLIDNGSGIVTAYAHNSSVAVSAGQSVKRGDVIAYVGSTGDSTGPHCHFEVRVNGTPQNPREWL